MSEHKPVKMVLFHDANNKPAMCSSGDFQKFLVADALPVIKQVFEATRTYEANEVWNAHCGIKDAKPDFNDRWLDDNSYVRKPLCWLFDDSFPKPKQILDAIHVPEMDDIANDEEGMFWIMTPNPFANYWTVGYRLERVPRTPSGFRDGQIVKLIEVYYPKIAPQQVENPEWLPKFAAEFRGRYYKQREESRDK